MNDIVDMAKFVEAKSDQLNADDLLGAPRTITITAVRGCDGDQPIAIHYKGDNNKPFKPCKTIRRVLLAIWGRNAADYVGRAMTLYRDDSVTFGGLNVGGIRISHMSHLEKETVVVVMKTKGKKAGIKVSPLKAAAVKHDPETGEIHDEQPAQTGRQKAEAWADGFLAKIKECADTDALIELQTKSKKVLDKLESEHGDLFELTVTAGTKRAAELQEAYAE